MLALMWMVVFNANTCAGAACVCQQMLLHVQQKCLPFSCRQFAFCQGTQHRKFATRKADPEKISAYECGFDPFDNARNSVA